MQCANRRLGDLTDPADFLAKLRQFIETVSGPGAALGTQQLPAGAPVLAVSLSAPLGFDKPVIVAPAAPIPAAIDGLMAGLTFFQG